MATVLVSLPIYDVEVYYDAQNNPQVRSNITKLVDLPASDTLEVAIASIHAVILGHYLSGVNLLSPEYLEGVKVAVRDLDKQLMPISNKSHSAYDLPNESIKTHPLATLVGKFSGPEWSETWEEIERVHNQLNTIEDQPIK